MRDQISELKNVMMLGAGTRTTDSTAIWIDRANYEAVSILLSIGAGGITFDSTNKIEFKLSESDASDGSGSNLVAEADLIGVTGSGTTGIVRSLVAAHASAASYMFGYRGNKRYLGIVADFSGTHGVGTPMACTAVLGMPRNSPTT